MLPLDKNSLSVSVVSHGHGVMVTKLLESLLTFDEVSHIYCTINIPESISLPKSSRVTVITNSCPKGFGQNHNFASTLSSSEYFCPINPDIIFLENPFPRLLHSIDILESDLLAPLVVGSDGKLEDSIRKFPTIAGLLGRAFGQEDFGYQNDLLAGLKKPDWVAGMFMLFRGSAYKSIGGFDEKYYMYCEDIDICLRLWNRGYKISIDPEVKVIHDAQRKSRSNPQHFRWHLMSMLRFFIKHHRRRPNVSN